MHTQNITSKCLLVIAPHPDDEILGCGYLMRRVQALGGAIVVVWMTDGGAAHGDIDSIGRAALVATRQAEARSGLAAMDITPVGAYFLAFRDGDLGADADRVQVAYEALCKICDAHAVDTLCVTSGADGHPDHRASFEIAARLPVSARYSYPISSRYDGVDCAPPADAITVDSAGEESLKRKALACHGSQSAAAGAVFPMSPATIERFCSGAEVFVPMAVVDNGQ